MKVKTKGLVIVHTGDGKGKTTAALGLAMRAWGDGLRVLILQFIKGGCSYGELKTIETLAEADGRICVKQCGLGFTKKGDKDEAKHKAAAKKAVLQAETELTSGNWDLVILDEINYAISYDLIAKKDALHLLAVKPEEVHVVFTGRDAKKEIIAKADLVTEMTLIKHPYQQGIKAQKGIEF